MVLASIIYNVLGEYVVKNLPDLEKEEIVLPIKDTEKLDKLLNSFSLEKTTKELFPNMEETYPGLKAGQEFTALVAHIENIDETVPKFQIHSYELN